MADVELIDFIDLSVDEKKMVLSWRNDPKVKKWMYTQKDITLSQHLGFIESLKKDKTKKYCLVKNKQTFIGVIDFSNIDLKSLEMGLYANPKLKGYGNTLLQTLIDYAFHTLQVDVIFAQVFALNEKAIALYKRFGFKTVDEIVIKSKKIIKMELKNEDK